MGGTAAPSRFFFVHLMKTGGATFRQHVYRNFDDGSVYPVPKVDDMDRAWLVDYLLGLPRERHAELRAYTGHFPFVVTEMLGEVLRERLVTLSVLRDPVDRTVSYLKHCKRYHEQHRDLSLDEIYDDRFYFDCFIHDHQTKQFSMTRDDKLESYMDRIDVDDRRLALACENLERVDVLGVTEHHDAFVDELRHRFGWDFRPVKRRRVGDEPWEPSRALRRRIAEDNAADVELHARARAIWERRAARS